MALVTLLAHTPQPELHVAAAAKLCYSPSSIDKIKEGLTEEKWASFVDMLSEIGHESPIEHATFTFELKVYPRFAGTNYASPYCFFQCAKSALCCGKRI